MNIYFCGIGGVGVGPLAEIAKDAGHQVVGSDSTESLMTEQLRSRGVDISSDQSGTFLRQTHDKQPIEWFVYTSAIPENHPELTAAKELGIKTSKRDELLARIIEEKDLKLIAIAGTHGKTTTTAMMVWTLQQLSIPVSYSVGTTLPFGPSGHFDPGSEYFVYECDEFDRNFLHFHPFLTLITAVDYDHPDTYPTEDAYFEAFRDFVGQSQKTILWKEDDEVLHADSPGGTTVLYETAEQVPSELPGMHNRRNASLVLEALTVLHVDKGDYQSKVVSTYDTLREAARHLGAFPGTARRFEKLADNLYSDYGHHPVEIAATLQLARELSDDVVLVYQPHQNVRQHEMQDLYTDDIFEEASDVYWLPTYLTREDAALPVLSPEELTKNIVTRDKLHFTELNDELWDNVQTARKRGALVLCMGAGTIDDWVRKKIAN